jgi:hypothetical protein
MTGTTIWPTIVRLASFLLLISGVRDWLFDFLAAELSRKSEEARTIRTLQVQLANFQEDIFKEELAVDAFSACYTTAGLVYPPSWKRPSSTGRAQPVDGSFYARPLRRTPVVDDSRYHRSLILT